AAYTGTADILQTSAETISTCFTFLNFMYSPSVSISCSQLSYRNIIQQKHCFFNRKQHFFTKNSSALRRNCFLHLSVIVYSGSYIPSGFRPLLLLPRVPRGSPTPQATALCAYRRL